MSKYMSDSEPVAIKAEFTPVVGLSTAERVVRLLNWPKTKTNGFVPWYVMLWRLVFMPLIYGGLALAWVGVAMANGPKQACRFWRNAT